MTGEAFMTRASLTMALFLQFLRRSLHNGDTPVSEFVDELRPADTGYLGAY